MLGKHYDKPVHEATTFTKKSPVTAKTLNKKVLPKNRT